MIFIGIGPNRGKVLESDADALAYAFAVENIQPVEGWDGIHPEFKRMLLEWEFSGDWVRYPDWAACRAENPEEEQGVWVT